MHSYNDKIGILNKVINAIYSKKIFWVFQKIVSLILHVELPIGKNELRLPHPYQILINSGTKLGKNITVFHGTTIGSVRSGKKVEYLRLEITV
jgi:serine acetyltransferase